jgi:hypothetical protein
MTMNGKVHIDLGPDGLDGQWIDVANVSLKSPKQFQRIQGMVSESTPESVRAWVAEVVVAWNITDPITGNPVPAPNAPDLDLNDLPMIATKRFTDCVQEQMEAVLPLASRSK